VAPLWRVLERREGELRVVSGDEPGVRTARGEGAPGDWVELSTTGVARVVDPYRSARPFPDPQSETYRLAGRRLQLLRARADIIDRVRAFFRRNGFLEVETPLLVPSPGLELHLDAIPAGDERWLITSPEYQMKRLLAAGAGRIFQIAKCFRRGELGRHHNVEFSMIEWYRAPGGYEQLMVDCEHLLAELAPERADLAPPFERLTMAEAFARYMGGPVPADADAFFPPFFEHVEPRLGQARPTILYEWPTYLSALARRSPTRPDVVERFELFAGGLELANAFGELVDPVEQRARLAADLAERRRLGKPLYPIDERFVAALDEGLPPCAGIALGLDRLVMLLLGAREIREVLSFAEDEL
jgi:lysyl-tRNA synthetase class 2